MLGTDLNYIVLNFDLSTERLKQCYTKSRRSAYREIQSFLESNGFEHRQYSGYVSRDKMSVQEVFHILTDLGNELPWMEYCAIRFDLSETRNKNDLSVLECFSTPKEKHSLQTEKPKLDLEGVSGSLTEQLQKSASVAKEHNAKATAKTKENLERS